MEFRTPYDGDILITQRFAERPWHYSRYGLAGHNGLDFICLYPDGRKVVHPVLWSMLPGVWHLISERNWRGQWVGYGAAWRLDVGLAEGRVEEWTFGHLQNRRKEYDNRNIGVNVRMGEMDNTGDSTGEHCHITLRYRNAQGQIENWGNGFHGAVDPLPRLKELGMKFKN